VTIPTNVRDTLRILFATYIGEVYDDPCGLCAEEIDELEAAGAFLGFDMWDRELVEALGGHRVTDYEFDRLKKLGT
jgi:hypothetical protein